MIASLPPCWAYLQEHVAILEQGEPHLIGGYMPQCDEAGYFKLTQCSGSTGYCKYIEIPVSHF